MSTSVVLPARAAAAAVPSLQSHGSLIPAVTSPAAVATEPLELLCFRVNGQEYGLPLHSIQEIRSYQTATPLPGQDAAMLGVMDLRGQVIALLDLRSLLGFPPASGEDADLRALVVLVQGEQRLGLLVDEVLDVLPVAPELLRVLPHLPGDFAHQHLRGMVSTGTRHVLLLEPGPWLAAHARAS